MTTAATAKRRLALLVVTILAGLFVPGLLSSAEAGALALPAGELFPQPRQRGTNDIEIMPTRELACPACAFTVAVPEADKLMQRPSGYDGPPLAWRMHFESRDQDFCPYPAKYKLAYQADIVICPSCGYAAPAGIFADPVTPEEAEWVAERLRPNLLATLRGMLGRRGQEMTDRQVAEFYNRQEEIPDAVRLEHERIRLAAIKAPWLEQARLARLAAWSARRGVAADPESVFLSRRAGNVREALKDVKRNAPGSPGEIAALRRLLGKTRSGKDRLNSSDRYAARMLLAGQLARWGGNREAEEALSELYQEFRERFLKPEQDPLWAATPSRLARTTRLNEMELYRSESERELLVRLELIRREREYLEKAVAAMGEAIRAGELAGRREEAVYCIYLTGEFHRRLGDLPLSSEWLRHVRTFAPDSAWAELAEEQLALVRKAAGDQVNLLAGLGQDAELFDILRSIF